MKWIYDHRSESQFFFRAISQLLKLRFTAMVTYSFHLYSRSSHNFILCSRNCKLRSVVKIKPNSTLIFRRKAETKKTGSIFASFVFSRFSAHVRESVSLPSRGSTSRNENCQLSQCIGSITDFQVSPLVHSVDLFIQVVIDGR